MSNAILLRMGAGIAGDVTRREAAVIEAQQIDATTLIPTAFGIPVRLVSGKLERLSTGGDVVYGFLVRPYPTQEGLAAEGLGTSTPNTAIQIFDVLRRGYMTVKSAGTPAKDGQVYYVTTTGAITASASSATAITGCYFMGAADADGNVEISFGIARA
jgi:hypothetical protein